ncbi:hypothetical protein MYP_4407 [Sporocytophaga myxococcoides]|uniref:Ezrin/radixin/moesin family protein n=1 Tax=Sporocytophaga myxococcoides TaxID=153721 RepID=A0A098LL75_9BACT|nr:hypothetical protein MYP_4407 [Sporocytophaga myxococcoides]
MFGLLMFLTFCAGYAQSDKETEKEWAKKLKSLTPMEYKKLVEEKDALSAQVSQTASLKSEVDAKNKEIEQLKKSLQSGGGAGSAKSKTVPGVVFKVQVGSFRNKDLSKYFDNNPNFSGEVDKDGIKKYTLGNFADYWEANTFKKALRDMGVKDAWIVAYKNGERVPIKDVLEGVL